MTREFDTMSCDASGVLPVQMPAGVRWNSDTSGPRALMLAMLADAVQCIEHGRQSRRFNARRLAAEAEGWVRSDRQDWLFSFVNVCAVLGFDADALRGRLLVVRNDASERRRARLRVPTRRRAMTLAPEHRRVAMGGAR